MKFTVVCPRCLKIYIDKIPIVSKDGMSFNCKKCEVVLVRFAQDGGFHPE